MQMQKIRKYVVKLQIKINKHSELMRHGNYLKYKESQ